MPNQLANEGSAYLLQHKDNPVEWLPWGNHIFDTAKKLDRPILLSIGYSACHWCHVMAHESFEDVNIAKLMNNLFVNVKVDREERPDIDAIYMSAVIALTRHGGWPLTVFLTPEGKPFFGGTYFPKHSTRGMPPAFPQVLINVAHAWENQRSELYKSAEYLTTLVETQNSASPKVSNRSNLQTAVDYEPIFKYADKEFAKQFDSQYGGFGRAPKFPQPPAINYLLYRWQLTQDDTLLQMAEHTLNNMAKGGICDHIAGGFARYSTDEYWLVPHFEKMLYDNALLTNTYLYAWQITKNSEFAKTLTDTLTWMDNEISHPNGAFLSSIDADSQGREGIFYTWTPEQIENALSSQLARVAKAWWNVTEEGNFEKANILHEPKGLTQVANQLGITQQQLTVSIDSAKMLLLQERQKRIPPAVDSKAITAWNAMAIDAFAKCGSVMNNPKWINRAKRCAHFVISTMFKQQDTLFRTWTASRGVKHIGTLEDYAFLANALVTLWEAEFDRFWLDTAELLCDRIITLFKDNKRESSDFYDSTTLSTDLIVRPRILQDAPYPSGGSMAAVALIKVGYLTSRNDFLITAYDAIKNVVQYLENAPTSLPHWLFALDLMNNPFKQIVVAGDITHPTTKAFLKEIRQSFYPRSVLAWTNGNQNGNKKLPLLEGKTLVNNSPALYICEDFICDLPLSTLEALQENLAPQQRNY